MTPHARRKIAILAVAVAAAVWWAGTRPDAEEQPATQGVPRSVAAAVAPTRVPANTPAAQIATPPMPPAGTSLPALWDTLEPAARAGHAPSACRLAVTTLACASHREMRRFEGPLPDRLPSGELEALQTFVADPLGLSAQISNPGYTPETTRRIVRLNADIDRHCGEVSAERRREAFAFLRQAALAGVPDAQVVYVSWGGGVMHLLPGSMSDPTFERWIDEAPTVLTRMLDAGHPEAPAMLAEAYGRDQFHGWLYPYDPVRATAYGLLAQRTQRTRSMAARFVEQRRAALSPAQRAEADRLASALYNAHYARRPLPTETDRRQWLGTLYLGIGPVPEHKLDECAPALNLHSR